MRAMARAMILLAATALAPCVSRGQLEVTCRLAHERVVAFEPVTATLEVVNNTAETLRLSDAGPEGRVAFEIEQTPGIGVRRSGDAILSQPVVVEAGKTGKVTVDLRSYLPVGATGPYTVRSRVDWGGRSFRSASLFLDVLPGLEIAHLTAGVPGDARALRTYSLRTLNRERSDRVFLRIDDEDDAKCYGVFDLGSIVRVSAPSLQVDQEGNVHVLHQSGPQQFTHSAFTPRGEPVVQKVYASGTQDVHINRGEDGTVAVSGSDVREAASQPAAE